MADPKVSVGDMALTQDELKAVTEDFRIKAAGYRSIPCGCRDGLFRLGNKVIGKCFRCGGKSRQNLSDFCRNAAYDKAVRDLPVAQAAS